MSEPASPRECWVVNDMGGTSVQYVEPTRDSDGYYLDQVSTYDHYVDYDAYLAELKRAEAAEEQLKLMPAFIAKSYQDEIEKLKADLASLEESLILAKQQRDKFNVDLNVATEALEKIYAMKSDPLRKEPYAAGSIQWWCEQGLNYNDKVRMIPADQVEALLAKQAEQRFIDATKAEMEKAYDKLKKSFIKEPKEQAVTEGFFKPEDFEDKIFTPSLAAHTANRLLAERGTVAYGNVELERQSLEAAARELIEVIKDFCTMERVIPIPIKFKEEPDTWEAIGRDLVDKCEKLEIKPNSFTHLDLSNLYDRARKLAEK